VRRRDLIVAGLGGLLAWAMPGRAEVAAVSTPVATPASAESTPPSVSPAPATPRPARRPRPQRRAAKPEDLPQKAEPVAPAPPEGPVFEAAPVPNRSLEAPRVVEKDAPRLSPSVIQRSLPSRGQATEGSISLEEERLFSPAPGARLNVPFRY